MFILIHVGVWQKAKELRKKMDRGPEQTFFQRKYIDGQRTLERMLNSPDHQKIQIKATVMHHFLPIRMTIIKKSTNNKCR